MATLDTSRHNITIMKPLGVNPVGTLSYVCGRLVTIVKAERVKTIPCAYFKRDTGVEFKILEVVE